MAEPQYSIGDLVTVTPPAPDNTTSYPAVITNVRAVPDTDGLVWVITFVSRDPHHPHDNAYQLAATGQFREWQPSLTLDHKGPGAFWPIPISADDGNRLTIGTDGGLYLGQDT